MKVYMLISDDGEESTIVATFLDKELADKKLAEYSSEVCRLRKSVECCVERQREERISFYQSLGLSRLESQNHCAHGTLPYMTNDQRLGFSDLARSHGKEIEETSRSNLPGVSYWEWFRLEEHDVTEQEA